MIPLPLLDGDTLVIDNSSLELQTTCPRAAFYGLCLRRRPTGERSALRFGGIAHKVLETRYRACTPLLEQTPAVQKVMIAVAEDEFKGVRAKTLDGLRDLVDAEGNPVWIKKPYIPPEDDYRTLDRMIALIDAYGKQYPHEPFDIARLPDGRPFIEVPFALPFAELDVDGDFAVQNLARQADGSISAVGTPEVRHIKTLKVVFCGRIDLAYRINNSLYILDHKTASIATNMAEFVLSHQFQGYTWAAETILKEPVSAVVINRMVIRKPSRTGEAFAFDRQVNATQRGLVEEWKHDILHILADFIEMVRRGYMPKHTQWCVNKFGTCQFHKVCSLGDAADALSEQRQIILGSGEYEENTWSPLAN